MKVWDYLVENVRILKSFEQIQTVDQKSAEKKEELEIDKRGLAEWETAVSSSYYSQMIYSQTADKAKAIKEYREMANFPEVADALDDITDEAISPDDNGEICYLDVDNDKISKNKNIMLNLQKEFDYIIEDVLDFDNNAFNLFRKFYVEAELYGELVINPKQPKEGVKKVVLLAPETMIVEYDEFDSIKNFKQKIEGGIKTNTHMTHDGVIEFKNNEIAYINSGIYNKTQDNIKIIVGYLDRAKVAYRQLKWMEDALVIYRIVRAPERRVFTIDVGNLPKNKAEEYMRNIINRYKQRKMYNPETGQVDTGKNMLGMTEDIWLPQRSDGSGPKVTNLQGGCLALDTEIPLLDGRTEKLSTLIEEFKQGKQNWIYSCDPKTGKVVPGIVSWAGITQTNAQVMKLTLDNGKEVICTPDHKFPVWGKGKVEAKDLTVEDSIIPFDKTDFFNYKIVKAEYLTERMDVGTLTIDKEEKYHSHHTFALACGVFTFNSNLGVIEDILYFVKKLYKALKVPTKRLDETNTYEFHGAEGSTTREEIKFAKYTTRVRQRFATWIMQIYITHLRLKGLYDQYKLQPEDIDILFYNENEWRETKKLSNLQNRLNAYVLLTSLNKPVFGDLWLKKEILQLTDEEIAENEKEIEDQKLELEKEAEKKRKEELANQPDGSNEHVKIPGSDNLFFKKKLTDEADDDDINDNTQEVAKKIETKDNKSIENRAVNREKLRKKRIQVRDDENNY